MDFYMLLIQLKVHSGHYKYDDDRNSEFNDNGLSYDILDCPFVDSLFLTGLATRLDVVRLGESTEKLSSLFSPTGYRLTVLLSVELAD